MQGWALLNQPPDRERMAKARALFERSLVQEPTLVSALVGQALSYIEEADFWPPPDPEAFADKAEGAIKQALAFDFNAPFAHQVKARVAGLRLNIPEAVAEAQLAVDLNRNDWRSLVVLSLYQLMAGQLDEAAAHAEQALRISPRDPLIFAPLAQLGRARIALGQPEAAWPPCSVPSRQPPPPVSCACSWLPHMAAWAGLLRLGMNSSSMCG